MKIVQIASEIAKREGHKSNAKIGDIREQLGILADMSYEQGGADVVRAIVQLGIARAKRKKNVSSKR